MNDQLSLIKFILRRFVGAVPEDSLLINAIMDWDRTEEAEEIPFGGQPPHYPKKEQPPIQGKITHDIAPAGSIPPKTSPHANDRGDEITDGAQDYAKKIAESV